MLREPIVARDTHRWRDPELRLDLLTNHMDMDRLPAFLTEKKKKRYGPILKMVGMLLTCSRNTKLVYPIRLGYQADSVRF